MELTLAGALFLLFVVIALILKTNLLVLLAFFLGFSAFAVVNIPAATFGVQPYHVLGGAAICMALYLFLSTHRQPRIGPAQPFFWAYLFVAAVIFSMLLLAFHQKIPSRILASQSVLLIFGVCVAASIFILVRDEDSLARILRWYLRGGVFVAMWGILQWACSILGIEYPSWIFNNSVSSAAELFDQVAIAGLPRINSVAIEPSYLGRYLGTLAAFMLVLDQSQARILSYGWIKLTVIGSVLVLSTSSTAYLCIGLVAMYVFFTDVRQFTRYTALALSGACAILLLHPEFIDVFIKMTIDKTQSGSYEERTSSMLFGYQAFANAPFFGNGWGWMPDGEGVHDTIFKICSSLGVVGFWLFLLFVGTTILSSWLAERATLQSFARSQALDKLVDTQEMMAILRALRLGLVVAMIADFFSGFSWVAANLWFMLGIVAASSRIAGELQWPTGDVRHELDLEGAGPIANESRAGAMFVGRGARS